MPPLTHPAAQGLLSDGSSSELAVALGVLQGCVRAVSREATVRRKAVAGIKQLLKQQVRGQGWKRRSPVWTAAGLGWWQSSGFGV